MAEQRQPLVLADQVTVEQLRQARAIAPQFSVRAALKAPRNGKLTRRFARVVIVCPIDPRVVGTDVLDAREGLREKLAEATDVQVSGAMDAVLRTMMTSEERANLLEYLVDNPEVAADLTEQTTSKKSRPTRTDWEYNTALASRLLTKLEGQISKPEPAVTKPKAEVVPITPPAKPKPVSAAPPPIEPVGARAGSAATRLDDPNIPTDEYMARRQQERMDKFRKQRA